MEPNVPSLLSSSSGCSSTLGHMVFGNSACIASACELMLRLSLWSKRKQPSVNIHDTRGLQRYLARGWETRSIGEGVGGDMSSVEILICSIHLLKASNETHIGVWFSMVVNHFLDY